MPHTPLNAAVIGLGWWGRTIVNALRDSDVIRIVQGVDPAPPPDAETALGIPVVADFNDALNHPDVEAVILCTPHVHHAAQIEAAAAAGKHVFCEKPLCTSGDEVGRAVAAVRAAGVVLGIGHERRFEPAVTMLRKSIADGEIGTPLMVEANFSQDKFFALPRDNWRFSTVEAPVGPLAATGIHLVDLSIAILGRPSRLWAQMSTRGSDFANGDTLGITVQFDSGATALLGACLATPFDGRLAVFGSLGWIEIRDRTHPEQPTGWDVTVVRRGAEPVKSFWPPFPAVRENLETFARAARGEAPYPVTQDEMIANVRSYEAVVRSVRSGTIELI